MGRCYEFATVIAEGCEHAMRVSPSGGACECPTCGVSCTGRFPACEAILQRPGYVPAGAPDWAVLCRPAPRADVTRGPVVASAPAAPAPTPVVPVSEAVVARVREEVALAIDATEARIMATLPTQVYQGLRPMLQTLGAELLDSIDAVRRELIDRTKELSAMQDRLHLLYQELATAFVDERETSEAVVDGLARVVRRVEDLGPPRY